MNMGVMNILSIQILEFFFCYIYAAFLPLIEDLSCVFLEKYSAYKNQLLPNFKRNETRMQRLSHFISYV